MQNIFDQEFVKRLSNPANQYVLLNEEERIALVDFRTRNENRTNEPEKLFAGEALFGYGPSHLRAGRTIPQVIVNLQRRSYVTAFNLYMPPDKLMAFQGSFFHSNYPTSQVVIERAYDPGLIHSGINIEQPNDNLSFDLKNPKRLNLDRKVYTAKEQDFSKKQISANPNAALAVIVYFASFQSYIRTLNTELESTLSARQQTVLEELEQQWVAGSKNAVHGILPAAYVSMHNADRKTLSREDFNEAFKFAYTNGVFLEQGILPEFHSKNMESTVFQCPARQTIAENLRQDSPGAAQHLHPPLTATVLYRIYMDLNERSACGDENVAVLQDAIYSKLEKRLMRSDLKRRNTTAAPTHTA